MREKLPKLAWALVPLAVLMWGLRRVLPTLADGLWGPEQPFLNGDFNGGWWLWWAGSNPDALGLLSWPDGVQLAGVIPNPTQMLLLGAVFGEPTALGWNLLQLTHLVLLVLSAFVLARAAGASGLAAAAGASLVAASPVLLHEVVGGRPDNLVVWPALLCLACLQRKGWAWGAAAGALAALQGLAYAWHGLALVLVGLPLVRDLRTLGVGVAVGAALITPYAVWLGQGLASLPTDTPEVGYTALPLSGLWPSMTLPDRFQVHPLLVPVALLGLRGGRRWLLAGGIGLLLAVGPQMQWHLGEPLAAGPWAWVAWAVPPAARMHHPVREALLAVPLLAVALAMGLDAFRWRVVLAVGLIGASAWNASRLDTAAAWNQPVAPPFADVPVEGPAVDVLGMHHRTALSLQTVHGQALYEPLEFRRTGAVEELSRGLPDDAVFEDLREAGFRQVLVLDRFGDGEATRFIVEEALGPPVSPGVYALTP